MAYLFTKKTFYIGVLNWGNFYYQPGRDDNDLRQRLIDSWSSFQQAIIDEALDQIDDDLGFRHELGLEADTLNI